MSIAPTASDWMAGLGKTTEAPGRWVGLQELAETQVVATHERLSTSLDLARNVAAMYLANWTAGRVAAAVGLTALVHDAGLRVDPDGPRWHITDSGHVDGFDLGDATILVESDHHWATEDRVASVDSDLEQTVIESLATCLDPLARALATVGRVGRTGVWTEIGDALVLAGCLRADVVPDPAGLGRVERLASVDVAPWRRRADLATDTLSGVPVCVGRKAGCCLAYTAGGDYCSTCRFRSMDDCGRRQLDWLRQAAGDRCTPR